ncbi:MAG: adenylate/guanylate cyclase domain-containing protein [Alphaproteobacteria bacterium]|nr:adenylate/guanylate cyclase domain-containing protein [Alphaproteobacteria bacterium]
MDTSPAATEIQQLRDRLEALQQEYDDLATIHEITLEHSNDIEMELDKRNALLHEVFGRYMTSEVLDTLLDQPDNVALGGERRRVTILMSDLRGFTPMCERLEPEQVVSLLNIHLGRMAEVISDHGGWVNEFIGDGILAVFGAPLDEDRMADRAVACGLSMQIAMEDVHRLCREAGLPAVEMGVGIHTGECVVGSVGSSQRAKFGLVGSAVNLTSRIESYTVGGQVLVSGATRSDLDAEPVIAGSFEVQPKGVRGTVLIHDVVGYGPLRLSTAVNDLVPLEQPVQLGMSVVDGKDATGTGVFVELVALCDGMAAIRTMFAAPAVRSNVKLWWLGTMDSGETYAKVVQSEGDLATIRFTAISPGDAVRFDALPRASQI